MSLKKRTSFLFVLGAIFTFLFLVSACQNSPNQNQSEANFNLPVQGVNKIGFDLDDTLLFSSPAFQQGFKSNVEPFSREFWGVVNSSDRKYSCIKPKTLKILNWYRNKGAEIYIITAREGYKGDNLRNYLEDAYNIPPNHVFFESDGKTRRLQKIGINVYFGDSDSDIKEAQAAGIKAIRIERSPESNYDKKYHPGKFNERIIKNTASHRCGSKSGLR